MPFFIHENITFHYLEKGTGIAFLFQHGLGGDVEAVFALIEPPSGFRLIGMDFRGHGKTSPLGAVEKIAFDCFADDLIALMDHLGIQSGIIGGTSMGGGVALNCALRYPNRVLGLVLQRPAWLDGPRPENVTIFARIAKLIREHGPQVGLEIFRRSPLYASIAAESNDSANSLVMLFTHPRAIETVEKLERIPQDAPNRDRRQWHKISVPTLVLANGRDPIHPFDYGKTLAQGIPGAEFNEVTPKSVNLTQYTADVRSYIGDFFKRHWGATVLG